MLFRTKKGITLIEVAAGLAILAMSMLFFSRMMADSASSTQAAADAKKLNMMARAAQTYINFEKADLEAFLTSPTQVAAIPLARNSETDLPPNGPHATLPSVQKAGLLAAAFVDSNALGQRHALLVREPAAGHLEGMVVAYGGTAMSDAQLGKVVQSLGIAGGGVFAKDVQPVTSTPVANANISGFAGGWVTPVASWNNFTVGGTTQTFAAGRPAISISMMDVVDRAGGGGSAPTGSFLSRVATANASDTRMATALDMGGNNINNAAQITATGQVRAAQFCDVNGQNCLGKQNDNLLKKYPYQVVCSNGGDLFTVFTLTGVSDPVSPFSSQRYAVYREGMAPLTSGWPGAGYGLQIWSDGSITNFRYGGSVCMHNNLSQLEALGWVRW